MKKPVLIIIAIIVVVAIAVFGYMVVSDLGQEKELTAELEEITTLVNAEELDTDQIQERLDRTVTNGDYATVERGFKQYISDGLDNVTRISEILEDERLVTGLTAENYQEDGPEFTETKAYIEETRQELQELKTAYSEFFTEEKAMSYINDKGLDSYFVDYYKNEVIGDVEAANDTEEVESSIDEVISILDTTENVINFLSENKDSWEIENNMIMFNDDNLSRQYDELVAKIQA